jgi:hypothetical protein
MQKTKDRRRLGRTLIIYVQLLFYALSTQALQISYVCPSASSSSSTYELFYT